MTDLSGLVALITGASRGIGAEIAKAYARAGAHVILVARTVGGLEEVDDAIREEGRGRATLMPLDLLKLDEIDKLGRVVKDRFGRLDIFVGNAGMLGTLSPVTHIKPAEWEKVMGLNLHANFRLIRTLDTLLKKADNGKAIFVTSGMAGICEAYWGSYAVSKAALDAMVKTYAAENWKTNVKVHLVRPGVVNTRMLHEAYPGGYQGKVKEPCEVVDTFLMLADPAGGCDDIYIDLHEGKER